MKHLTPVILIVVLIASGCTSTKKLTYLNNLSQSDDPQIFPYQMTDYKIQYRDVLYIDVKAQDAEGKIDNILQGSGSYNQSFVQSEASQYLIGYTVDKDGFLLLPIIGKVQAAGRSVPEIKQIIQEKIDAVFRHAYVDVKLLSFKFTVLGEVRTPGTYTSYNDYLTVLEAIGRAGGVGDFGRRDKILVIRSTPEGSKTFTLNLQDKAILTSEAYFLMPNDLIIIEPVKHKIFNMNLPSISFAVTTITSIITTTLLLINYLQK